jgi:hypothetical protein
MCGKEDVTLTVFSFLFHGVLTFSKFNILDYRTNAIGLSDMGSENEKTIELSEIRLKTIGFPTLTLISEYQLCKDGE